MKIYIKTGIKINATIIFSWHNTITHEQKVRNKYLENILSFTKAQGNLIKVPESWPLIIKERQYTIELPSIALNCFCSLGVGKGGKEITINR